jgi:hypothetical protein
MEKEIQYRLRNARPFWCTACMFAKATKTPWRMKAPVNKQSVPAVQQAGDCVSADQLCGINYRTGFLLSRECASCLQWARQFSEQVVGKQGTSLFSEVAKLERGGTNHVSLFAWYLYWERTVLSRKRDSLYIVVDGSIDLRVIFQGMSSTTIYIQVFTFLSSCHKCKVFETERFWLIVVF